MAPGSKAGCHYYRDDFGLFDNHFCDFVTGFYNIAAWSYRYVRDIFGNKILDNLTVECYNLNVFTLGTGNHNCSCNRAD